ncbi:Uncharacterised protein [Vibrio cholerae]|uniref:Uncharacterized protein n=1 Tax=Vibrio cholerae TaxID=666 RepID=A0A655WIA0_VIBCL|nr:Uncharacterised protein [Vibrio cholerae]CSB90727.1 Uncharacterised protein [Vibrio cholerae]CSC32698.1 Uncharacterised protein [Vibrio cholerae]
MFTTKYAACVGRLSMAKKLNGALKKALTLMPKPVQVGISTANRMAKRGSSPHLMKRRQKCPMKSTIYGSVLAVFLSTGTLAL